MQQRLFPRCRALRSTGLQLPSFCQAFQRSTLLKGGGRWRGKFLFLFIPSFVNLCNMVSAPWNLSVVDLAASLIFRNLLLTAVCLFFFSTLPPNKDTSQGSILDALVFSVHTLFPDCFLHRNLSIYLI